MGESPLDDGNALALALLRFPWQWLIGTRLVFPRPPAETATRRGSTTSRYPLCCRKGLY